ncbi:hypothetical protein Tco_0185043 [Tanacetum coccineum]
MVAEKTSELERCLSELQDILIALEAAESRNAELTHAEIFSNSLQEALSQRDMILQKCAQIMAILINTPCFRRVSIVSGELMKFPMSSLVSGELMKFPASLILHMYIWLVKDKEIWAVEQWWSIVTVEWLTVAVEQVGVEQVVVEQ